MNYAKRKDLLRGFIFGDLLIKIGINGKDPVLVSLMKVLIPSMFSTKCKRF